MPVFRPAFPAVLPNPQNIFEGMVTTNCSIALTVPTFLEDSPSFVSFSLEAVERLGLAIPLP